MVNIKNIVRQVVPLTIRRYLHISLLPTVLREDYYLSTIHRLQRNALERLKGKETIKICFFALYEDVWKYDSLFKMMMDHPRFEPLVLVCPVVHYGYEDMVKRMEKCYEFFKGKGYETILSYNPLNNTYIDVKKDINPDIIAYTNPYKDLIDDHFYIDRYRDILTIYVPYSINNSQLWTHNYNLLLHNLLWRHYLATERHQSYAKKYSRNKGENTVVVGYPGIEDLIAPKHQVNYLVWKSCDQTLKKIIWAPHHTIIPVGPNGSVSYSCFLQYHEIMLRFAEKYKEYVQFAFKPHPLLKNRLEKLWGKGKTSEYYKRWASMDNTCINEGDYIDLFLSSDAMIHDSGSFISEYLYVNKPVMRTLNEVGESEKQNDFAMDCVANHYLAYNEQDIESFIQNVINGIDPLKEQRTKFVNEVLMPNGSPSQNIIEDILNSIDNQILYH